MVLRGGPPVAGLNRRPYVACHEAMKAHIQQLSSYCDSMWALRTRARSNAHRPYVYCQRRLKQEEEEAPLQRALTKILNTRPMPFSSLCDKGGGGGSQFCNRSLPDTGRR